MSPSVGGQRKGSACPSLSVTQADGAASISTVTHHCAKEVTALESLTLAIKYFSPKETQINSVPSLLVIWHKRSSWLRSTILGVPEGRELAMCGDCINDCSEITFMEHLRCARHCSKYTYHLFMLTSLPWNRLYELHSLDQGTKAQWGQVSWPRSHRIRSGAGQVDGVQSPCL